MITFNTLRLRQMNWWFELRILYCHKNIQKYIETQGTFVTVEANMTSSNAETWILHTIMTAYYWCVTEIVAPGSIFDNTIYWKLNKKKQITRMHVLFRLHAIGSIPLSLNHVTNKSTWAHITAKCRTRNKWPFQSMEVALVFDIPLPMFRSKASPDHNMLRDSIRAFIYR